MTSDNTPPPTLSVIMAAYNAEEYICESIRSILSQTFQDFEFIIIDDGSTDTTFLLITSFHDHRIIPIVNETNRGLAYSLNKGISCARSNNIVRMDADDVSYPDRFTKLISESTQYTQYSIICSRALIIHKSGEENQVSPILKSPEEIYVNLQFTNCILHSSVLIKKEILEKYGRYDELFRFAQDYEMWNRLSKKVLITQIQKPLIEWRAPTSTTKQKKKAQWEEAEKLIFNRSCDYYLHSWQKIIPPRLIYSTKLVINPHYKDAEKIKFFDLLLCPLVFCILTRKIIQMAPIGLNKKTMNKNILHWKKTFLFNWIKLLLSNFKN